MRLEFEQIELHNYGSHKDTVFPILSGRHLIVGKNGEGKSTLFEGLVACLYKAARSRDPSFNHQGNCEVKAKFKVDDKQLEARRYWGMKDKIKSPQIFVDDEELGFRRSTESEKELAKIVSIPYDLFVMTVVVMQGLPLNFCALGPTVRKTIIEDLFGLNVWDAFRKKFNETLKEDMGIGSKIRGEYEGKKESMIALNSKIQTARELEGVSEEIYQKEVIDLETRVQQILCMVKNIQGEHSAVLKAERQVEIRDQMEVLSSSVTLFDKKRKELTSVVNSGKCYACHRDYPHAMIESAGQEVTMLNSKVFRCTKLLEETRHQQQILSEVQQKINAYTSEVNALQYQIKSKSDIKATPKAIDFDALGDNLADIQSLVNSLNENLSEIEINIKSLQYIDGLLKPSSEFRTQVLNDRIGYINSIMTSITPLLFDGIECQLLLTSSGVDIDLKRREQKVEYKELSGGEKRRIDLILIFSFQKYIQEASGISSNLLVFDEIFENLDAEGVDSVLSCVESLFPEASSIYVISHRENIKSQFTSVVRVSKGSGGASTVNIEGTN